MTQQNAHWSPQIYQELRRLAAVVMGRERASQTLQPTALVNEVWLRLLASRNVESMDRPAFLGLAAQAMRSILTEHARRRGASKRGGGWQRTTLTDKAVLDDPQDFAIDMNASLTELAAIDTELAQLVELRFYGGCTVAEISGVLAISPRTIKRRWRFARAWLQRRMLQRKA